MPDITAYCSQLKSQDISYPKDVYRYLLSPHGNCLSAKHLYNGISPTDLPFNLISSSP
jgi:hypothetical protein